jgi:hypothetical protein
MAWLGLAYLGSAWPGSRLQAGPSTALGLSSAGQRNFEAGPYPTPIWIPAIALDPSLLESRSRFALTNPEDLIKSSNLTIITNLKNAMFSLNPIFGLAIVAVTVGRLSPDYCYDYWRGGNRNYGKNRRIVESPLEAIRRLFGR